jgi:hypothetical protein
VTTDPHKVERLMALTERLTEALSDDIAALERGRPREMRTPQPEVQQLTALYRNEAAYFTLAVVNSMPKDVRDRLSGTTARFKDVLAQHCRVLSRVKTCSEGMIRAIADDVAKSREAQRPYSPVKSMPKGIGAIVYNKVV